MYQLVIMSMRRLKKSNCWREKSISFIEIRTLLRCLWSVLFPSMLKSKSRLLRSTKYQS